MFSEGYKIAKKYHKNYYFLCKSWYIKNGFLIFPENITSVKSPSSTFRLIQPRRYAAIAACLKGVETYKEIHKND